MRVGAILDPIVNMLHSIHQSPEDKLALNSEGQLSAVSKTCQKLDEVKQAIQDHHETAKDKTIETLGFTGVIQNQQETTKIIDSLKDDINHPIDVVRKLEEVKSAGLITNKLLKDISKKEVPEPKEFPKEMEVSLRGVSVVTIKGDKGDRGEKGERGITGGQGTQGERGSEGKTGKVGTKGAKGDRGEKGKDGLGGADGTDGSPDTPDEIIAKINSSIKKIDAEQVRGLADLIRAIERVGTHPVGYGGGGANDPFRIRDEVPSGSGTTFTLTHSPRINTLQLFRGGARQQVGIGNDYTISNTSITLSTTLTSGEVLLADYDYSP